MAGLERCGTVANVGGDGHDLVPHDQRPGSTIISNVATIGYEDDNGHNKRQHRDGTMKDQASGCSFSLSFLSGCNSPPILVERRLCGGGSVYGQESQERQKKGIK